MNKSTLVQKEKNPNARLRLCNGLALMCSVTVLLFFGCSKKSAEAGKAAGAGVPVLVAKAITTNVPVRISAIGNVMAYSSVNIRAQVTGQLRDVHFKEGEEVKKDALLFTIDPRWFDAALAQAKADSVRDEVQLQNLQMQFEREKKLFDQKISSQEEYDNARAALASAQAVALASRSAITNAALNLEYTVIRSPINGVVGAQMVYPGNIIKAEDDQMAMINQIHPISVLFSVPEQYLAEIKAEMNKGPLKVEVTFQNMTGLPSTGELTFIDNAVDQNTGTIQLKGTFGNEDNQLWPGQFVRVMLTLSEMPNVVVVPAQAIQTGQNGQYVYVLKDDQTVEQRPVQIGVDKDGLTVLQNGLRAGETVVTDGHLRLAPGTKVSLGTNAPPVTQPAAAP